MCKRFMGVSACAVKRGGRRRGGQNLQTGCGCDTCEGKQNRETDPGSGARTAVQLGKISARAEIVGSVHWAEMALLYSVVSLALAFLLP